MVAAKYGAASTVLTQPHQAQTALQGDVVFWTEGDIRKTPTPFVAALKLTGNQDHVRNRAKGGKPACKLLRRDIVWQPSDEQADGTLFFCHAA